MERDSRGVLDGYHLGEALGPTARLLGTRCGAAAVDLLSSRLQDALGAAEDDRYSYMWRPAVEEHEQNTNANEYRAALLEALRDTALGASSNPGEDARHSVQLLLGSAYPTVVRVGIYACSENYAAVGEQFWSMFKQQWLVDIVYWHEAYWLLKNNYPRFTAAQRRQFLAVVKELRGDWGEHEDAADWDERHRRDILHAVAGLGDSEVDAEYDSLVARWGQAREHPDFHAYHSAGWVGDRSPVTTDALLGLSDQELLKLLREFVPEPRSWDGPNFRGLASAIAGAVRASEDGFAARLSLFAELARPYQHGILSGLRQRLVEDKKPVDWDAALRFVEQLVSSPTFRLDLVGEQPEGWEPSVHWVAGDISDLLRAGAAADHALIDSPQYERCVSALKLIVSAVEPTPATEAKDPVSHAINVPRGRALETIIHIALSMRHDDSKSDELQSAVWALVGPIFDTELESSTTGGNAEFAALCGLYCTNLHFLDAAWVEQQFDKMFSLTSDAAWRCAAEGFAYQRYMYPWLFRRLVDGGHLRRMLFTADLSDHVSEKALQFLGLAYLEGEERLVPGGLLAQLVDSLNIDHLKQLCWFFWTLRPGGGTEVRSPHTEKILEFWGRVSEAMRAKGMAVPELYSALNHLAPFIATLDEPTTVMWAETAKYAQVNYHGHILVENMARLAPQFPMQVFEVFRATLSEFLPDFDAEEVVRCVNAIADAGHQEQAEWLCNAYADRGSTLLKATYDALRDRGRTVSGT